MSGIEGHNGYYIRKTGERIDELLSRQFVVPTLNNPPTKSTMTWADGAYEVKFRVGELVRVKNGNDYIFYRLKNVSKAGAIWEDITGADMSNYYTKKEIDDKFSNIVIPDISGTGGGVEIVSEEEYAQKKKEGSIVDNVMYFIVVNNEPYELYIGYHLIGKRGEIENISFPYTFPIIF